MPSGEKVNSNVNSGAEAVEMPAEAAIQIPRETSQPRGRAVAEISQAKAKAEAQPAKLSPEDLLNLDLDDDVFMEQLSYCSDAELAEMQARYEEEERAREAIIAQIKAQEANSNGAPSPIPEPELKTPAATAENTTEDNAAAAVTAAAAAPAASHVNPNADISGIDVVVADGPDADLDIDIDADLEEPVDPNAATAPIIPPIDPERTQRMNTISPAEANSTYDAFWRDTPEHKSRVKEFFSKTSHKVISAAMAALIVATMAISAFGGVINNNDHDSNQSTSPGIEQTVDQDDEADDIDQDDEDFLGTISDRAADQSDKVNQDKPSEQAQEQSGTQETEQATVSGELPNGTHYNYSSYADYQHKESHNAFGYDASDCFNNIEKSKAGILQTANEKPEALAAYAYGFFNDAEKAELGISGMKATDIDDYISNNPDGGAMQQRLLAALEKGLNAEDTSYNFYYENDTEQTDYIYFVDDNHNGKMDPTEMHLAYDTKDRNNAPQLDISRSGEKVLDLNLPCGWQTNYEPGKAPVGVPYVPADQVTDHGNPDTGAEGNEDTGTEGNEDTGTEGNEDTGTEGNEDTGTEGNEDTGTEGNEDTGTEGNEDTGDEGTLDPKNEKAWEENAGDRVDQRELDEDVTPATTLEEDKANFEDIEQQRQEDEAAAAEAERVAAEQAAAEQQAAEEAEQRRQAEEEAAAQRSAEEAAAEAERQAAADAAAAAAAEQAAAEQAAAAEAERQAAAEEQAREEAQQQADEQVAANEEQAAQTADDTAAERANAFNNGDF